ncbi:Cyclic nucleotide-gated olfactory channel [Trichinella zimbabwensis]|uniref:Cyclic nucleotide-gated olfactory channel n=1 Tax=Trichinella zimbabwensis TaxID=268475 RepID=A0A0V1H1X1_9BILA|nr:Cyclic nucleotide-gated olfactory channel [Trichinella zimbabwensis]
MLDNGDKQEQRTMVLANAQDPRLISEEGEGVVQLRCGLRKLNDDDIDDANVNPSTTITTFDRHSTTQLELEKKQKQKTKTKTMMRMRMMMRMTQNKNLQEENDEDELDGVGGGSGGCSLSRAVFRSRACSSKREQDEESSPPARKRCDVARLLIKAVSSTTQSDCDLNDKAKPGDDNAKWNLSTEIRRLCLKIAYDPVNPSDGWYKIWLGVVALAYLYNMVVVVARVSFFARFAHQYANSVWPFVVDYITDVVYIFDVYVQMRQVYLEQGCVVLDRSRLFRHNASANGGRNLTRCIASVAPADHLLALVFGQSALVSASRFNRLLRSYRLVEFVDMTETETRFPNLFRAIQLAVIVYLIFHWAACFYYLMSLAYGLELDSWVYNSERMLDPVIDCPRPTCGGRPAPRTSTPCQKIAYPELLKHYLLSFYWAALVLTSVGEQPFPIELGQYVFTVCNIIAGTLIVAALIGNVRIVVISMNMHRSQFLNRLDGVKRYMELHKVQPPLRGRILNWFNYLWDQKQATDEAAVMQLLPLNLRTEMASALHMRTLRKARVFKDCDPGLLAEMVLKLRMEIFSPGDYVFRRGDVGKHMYIVKRGVVNVVAEDGVTVFVSLNEGSVFGELSILDIPGNKNENKRTASVRCVGFAELFVLTKNDLLECLEKYPDAHKQLLDKGKEILRKDRLLIETEVVEHEAFNDNFEQQQFDNESLDELNKEMHCLWRRLQFIDRAVRKECDKTEQRVTTLERQLLGNATTILASRPHPKPIVH